MIRNPIMNSVLEACSSLCNPASDTDNLLELIIDCSALIRLIKSDEMGFLHILFAYIDLFH